VVSEQLPLYIFAFAVSLAVVSGVADLYVHVQLRKLGVPIRFGSARMPTYLLRLCSDLPPSATRNRLVRIAWWATLGFLIAFLLGAATGPLLAGGPHG
jgi:hypothetical protein